jgi:hypothetical protein
MEKFLEILNELDPISLAEMDSVKLLNRMDVKYIFHKSEFADILTVANEFYRTLTINERRFENYDSLYFDTEDFKLYYAHHNGRSNRFKLRMRTYIYSDLHFFEIKFKSNQNRTIKKRVQLPKKTNEITGNALELLQSKTSMPVDDLKPALRIKCKRITLVDKSLSERVTLDFDMKYNRGDDQWHEWPELVIAEVKQEKSGHSAFIKIMYAKHIRQISLSKYCFGIANYINTVRKNNFKTRLHYVDKICKNHAI